MIRLENVTKSYSTEVVALRDASFDVAKAEFVFLVGPSGSGKSTLLRMMNRQERPEKGSVWVAGRNINEMSDSKVPHLRRNIGNIFQDYKLLPNRTVHENVAFALEVIGRPKHVIRQQVPAVLDLVGLSGKQERFPHQLSGGEQQRVSIARAFVNRPLILLADEPTGNLDPATGEGIMRLLDRINKTGTTVVMATHDQRIVNMMRKRVHPTRPRHHRARPGQGCLRMISRLRYTLREMWASLTRNLTLTVAAVITSMVSLFLFGMTLLIQQAFDNQLSQWTGGVKMIVYVKNGAEADAVDRIKEALESRPEIIQNVEYCDVACSLGQAQKLFAADPESLKFLSEKNIPSYFSVEPVDKDSIQQLLSIRQSFVEQPGVLRADFPSDQITVLGQAEIVLRRTNVCDVGCAAVRISATDLEHDSNGDVRAPSRDRGDEVGRRNQLVHPTSVHARRPVAGPRRGRVRQHPAACWATPTGPRACASSRPRQDSVVSSSPTAIRFAS